MIKYIEFGVRVLLDTWEAGLCSIGAAVLLWAFGLGGVVPQFELQTLLYIGLWLYTMYAVAYEMVRHWLEERARLRAALFFL